jgi:hypothetical protein
MAISGKIRITDPRATLQKSEEFTLNGFIKLSPSVIENEAYHTPSGTYFQFLSTLFFGRTSFGTRFHLQAKHNEGLAFGIKNADISPRVNRRILDRSSKTREKDCPIWNCIGSTTHDNQR